MWFLEETLTHLSHSLLVFADLLWDTDKHGELRGQVDVLALLLDFKQGLLHLADDLVVLLLEVGSHGDGRSNLTLLEVASLWAHIKAHIADLVSFVVAVTRHNYGTLELILDGLLDFLEARRLIRVADSLLAEALNLLVDELKAVVNRQILTDVVDDEVETPLEDPGGGKESWPRLHSIVEDLGLGAHKEARIPANLAQVRVAHLGLDDGVYEVQGKGVFLHAHRVQIIQGKLTDALDENGKLASKEERLCLKVNLLVNCCGRENVVADAYVISKDLLELVSLGRCTQNFILLESLQIVHIKIADDLVISSPRVDHLRRSQAFGLFKLACSGHLAGSSWLLGLLLLGIGDV